jgi:hypothetical protein
MVWSSARQIPEALDLLEQAIAPDPHYGPLSPGPRFAVIGYFSTVGAMLRRSTV